MRRRGRRNEDRRLPPYPGIALATEITARLRRISKSTGGGWSCDPAGCPASRGLRDPLADAFQPADRFVARFPFLGCRPDNALLVHGSAFPQLRANNKVWHSISVFYFRQRTGFRHRRWLHGLSPSAAVASATDPRKESAPRYRARRSEHESVLRPNF